MAKVDWKNKIRDIISASQESPKPHGCLMKDLRAIYDSMTNKGEFAGEYMRLLLYPIVFKEKSSLVNNALSFFAKFTVLTAPEDQDDEIEEDDCDENKTGDQNYLFEAVLKFVVKILDSTNSTVRWRSCDFLELVLAECAHQKRSGALNEALWNKLTTALTTRCRDRAVRVRFCAVGAVSKIQQPKDADCPAIQAISFLMRYDPSSLIRTHCVRLVSTTKPTIALMVERCRDANELVRRTVYNQIADRNLFKYLTIEQRLAIIDTGLTDSSETVRGICKNRVIESWLQAVEDNIPDFIWRLDFITSEKTCEMVLDIVFQQQPLNRIADAFAEMTNKWENDEWLTPERIFSLHRFVRFILSPQKKAATKVKFDAAEVEEWMEQLLPPLYSLVEFTERYVRNGLEEDELDLVDGVFHRDFIHRQLFELLTLVDKSDAAGRNRLQKMLEAVVADVNYPALPGLVQLQLSTTENMDRTMEWMAEVISELTALPTPTQNVSNGGGGDNVTMSVLEFSKLSLDGNNLDDSEDSIAVNLFKALTVLSEVLKCGDVKKLTTTLRSLYENLVLPSIQNADPATRNLAFLCLGLTCLLDENLASKHLILFIQTLKVDVDAVRKTSVEVLFDLLLMFRDRLVKDNPKEDKSNEPMDVENDENEQLTIHSVVSELVDILDSNDETLHDVVALGVAKLRIYAPDLLPTPAAV